ncbi:Asp-tRNA(Asn)/Glu-tRNA(Gln) amidotransferase subunit GatC [Brevibacterium sp. 50QC2O2]|jgi:aspartyl-tRNA(Asn)/glutamyl-tRNA(Gln) amidotransferase subunit C|uniref:Asp-tRNA(Asn)/Glu-tRNA(Gln) amidotransferase subunit GatC n=1 Tax=unclassified Brevibacterium TaxID=2614124 RepID=UPI00211CFF33|nr:MULTISPECIES: Asp-tRNA(Asn)/Glu-tRNA(Gln) amidotransferase subunit GatC [unclassified Brevibacterium]MCQ9367562.1 Asp-tRNA(Asn)/Glu-tRNA(Gln) amidotransferase subunit GatC [Brevibacterium sp. 91QC2O2]MCQ9389436.1 Asp-tRNA(Asn)/Glu-tRNA(Gln) amidotransferase subunit GatC [Brevibacterium sp. 50QC2O2]
MPSQTPITTEEVAHLADLARIAMSDTELNGLAGDLNTILANVARVSEVATDDVPATSHPIPLVNVMREDVVSDAVLSSEQALSNAPKQADDKFLVPQILGEE